jgi:peptidoglycan/LPS O-acetylase OafA/YrhL
VRLARIYPLYIVVTLLCAVLGWVGLMPLYYVHSVKWALPWNITLLQSLSFGAGNINLPAWSLSTEWVAYLVFPVFAWWILVGAQRKIWLAVGLAIIILLGLAWASLSPPDGIASDGPLSVFDTATPLPVLRCFAGFILGMAAYRLKDAAFGRVLASRTLYGDLLALAVVALLFVPAGDVALVVLATTLILHLAVSGSFASRALESPVVHYLGVVSYSIYLVHIPLILTLRTLAAHFGLPALVANLAGIALTFVVAPLTYRYIELPGRNLIRRLIEPRRVRAPAAWG